MDDVSSKVIYDGFNFGMNGLVVTNLNHLKLATRNNQLEKRANRDGAVLVESSTGEKPIYITGYYDGVDAIDAQEMYDTLAAALNRQERLLIVPHAGGERRYIATPQNVILEEPDGLNRLTFDFEFVVPEGQSAGDIDITLINTTVTSGTATVPLDVKGSVVARPLISLTYSGVTNGTNKSVSIRNARDYIGLTIVRNWSDGDSIVIDSNRFQIYINGQLTDPVGRFPTWAPGAGSLYYSDTLSSRSVHLVAGYKPKNL